MQHTNDRYPKVFNYIEHTIPINNDLPHVWANVVAKSTHERIVEEEFKRIQQASFVRIRLFGAPLLKGVLNDSANISSSPIRNT